MRLSPSSALFLTVLMFPSSWCWRFSFFKRANETEIECGITQFSTSCSNSSINRIIGGDKVSVKEIPWPCLISIETRKSLFYCGGTLISKTLVLSAAHCFFLDGSNTLVLSKKVLIYLGSIRIGTKTKYSQKARVEDIVPHYSYEDTTLKADIALLKLKKPVHYTKGVRPICLPSNKRKFSGMSAMVSGFGESKKNFKKWNRRLHRAEVTVLENSHEYCKNGYKNTEPPQTFLCAYTLGSDFCYGDSGGPLTTMLNGKCTLIGVISNSEECATAQIAGLYVRVSLYSAWIQMELFKFSLLNNYQTKAI